MFVSYWTNLTFINTLSYEYQTHFYELEFYNALYFHKGKITPEFAESLLYEIAKTFDDNVNIDDDTKKLEIFN